MKPLYLDVFLVFLLTLFALNAASSPVLKQRLLSVIFTRQ